MTEGISMKYYKISEQELNKLINEILDNIHEDEYHEAKFNAETGILSITGHYGVSNTTIQFEEIKDVN